MVGFGGGDDMLEYGEKEKRDIYRQRGKEEFIIKDLLRLYVGTKQRFIHNYSNIFVLNYETQFSYRLKPDVLWSSINSGHIPVNASTFWVWSV